MYRYLLVPTTMVELNDDAPETLTVAILWNYSGHQS